MDLQNHSENLLFKFMPININLVRLLINHEIWFSPYSELNDPHEGVFQIADFKLPSDKTLMKYFDKRKLRTRYSYSSEEYVSRIKSDRTVLDKDIKQELINDYFNLNKVASFSLTYEEILLWSHYANEHRGVCLVFDKEILENETPELDYTFEKVSKQKVKYLKRKKIKIVFRHNKDNVFLAISNFDDVAFRKLRSWSYEKEYRILVKHHNLDKNNDGVPINFNKQALRGIIFGERCSSQDVELMRSLLSSSGYVTKDFLWGFSRIIPHNGRIVTTKNFGKISSKDLSGINRRWGESFFY